MSVIDIVKKQERELGMQEGLSEGLQKGRLEERVRAEAEKLAEKKTSAIKMLQSGFEVSLIADILGLPPEEIEKLKQP